MITILLVKLINFKRFERAHFEHLHVVLIKTIFAPHCCADNKRTFESTYWEESQVHHVRIKMQASMRPDVLVSSVWFLADP
jgi:hypothetical protein